MFELFHINIETRGKYKTYSDFEENDSKGAKLFFDKFNRTEWKNKYSDINEAYIENSPLLTTYGEITCISYGFIDDNNIKRIGSKQNTSEKDILLEFNKLMSKVEEKNFYLIGFRLLYFDIPWILHKMHSYNITPVSILTTYNKRPWDTRLKDLSDDWKLKLPYYNSFDEVCYELNVENSQIDTTIHDKYWNGDLEYIKNHCEKNIEASINVSKIIYNIK